VSTIEIVAAVIGAIGVYLAVRQNIWSWPIGIAGVALYVIVYYRARLYAAMGLQVVFIIISLYGWYQWLYGGPGQTTLLVTRAKRHHYIILAVLGVAGAWLTGLLLGRHTDASLPWLDSAATSTSLVAQWMMTRKLLESWIVWVTVDLVYIGMFIYKELYPTAVLYVVFTILAAWGYFQWKATLRPPVPA
jgi:nicotinamide mononucleotide transporter